MHELNKMCTLNAMYGKCRLDAYMLQIGHREKPVHARISFTSCQKTHIKHGKSHCNLPSEVTCIVFQYKRTQCHCLTPQH